MEAKAKILLLLVAVLKYREDRERYSLVNFFYLAYDKSDNDCMSRVKKC